MFRHWTFLAAIWFLHAGALSADFSMVPWHQVQLTAELEGREFRVGFEWSVDEDEGGLEEFDLWIDGLRVSVPASAYAGIRLTDFATVRLVRYREMPSPPFPPAATGPFVALMVGDRESGRWGLFLEGDAIVFSLVNDAEGDRCTYVDPEFETVCEYFSGEARDQE